jgi:hypothetical protein
MAGISVGVSGVWKAAKPSIGVSGVWKPVKTAYVGVNGVWKMVYTGMTAALSPNPATWAGYEPESGIYTSQTVSATPTGGTSPYTYAWTALSGIATCLAPTSASTGFIAGEPLTTSIQCVITDANGTTATATGTIG